MAPGHGVEEATARGRRRHLEIEVGDLIDAEMAIDSAQTVVPLERLLRLAGVVRLEVEVGGRLPAPLEVVARGDKPDVRIPAHVALVPEDGRPRVAAKVVEVLGV
jgi:hypothetical protein